MDETTNSAEALSEAWRRYADGDMAAAEAACRAALSARPGDPEAEHLLGGILYAVGRFAEAAERFASAVAAEPTRPDWQGHLAQALLMQDRLAEARASLEAGLSRAPLDPRLNAIMAQAAKRAGDKGQALLWYKKALAMGADDTATLMNAGLLLTDMGQAGQGLPLLQEAARRAPDDAELRNGLAWALYELARPAESLIEADAALALAPNHVEAHVNKAHALLVQGRMPEGWIEYEWRLRRPGQPSAPGKPRWSGREPVDGKAILLRASEQGYGDVIQYVRLAQRLHGQGATVIVEAPRGLVPLLDNVPFVDDVVEARRDGAPPDVAFDTWCEMMSLPALLGVSEADIPANVPYLEVSAERVRRWRKALGDFDGLTVGLAWRGGSAYPRDVVRSMPTPALAALADVPARFVSLQKQEAGAPSPPLEMIDFGAELDADAPFLDTAALMQSLDIVVSVDTAVAHLAGALGRPTWLLLSFAPDPRWMLGRTDSPWYPTHRLCRQPAPGDWTSVLAEVAFDLARLSSEGRV